MKGEMMTEEERQRMIHIRISGATHRELRKVAAENDQTMQELVVLAVERTVEETELLSEVEEIKLKLEEKARKVEERAFELEERSVKIESRNRDLESREIELEVKLELELELTGEPVSQPETLIDRIKRMEKLVSSLSSQLQCLKNDLADHE
jgi:uncharacterized protein (DUF3084 family)